MTVSGGFLMQGNVDRAGSETRRLERSLVGRFQRGTKGAYDEIYATYLPVVSRICGRFLIDRRDVEEAVQDTFVKAFLALGRFNGDYRLGPWLKRIATNTAIDQARRVAGKPSLSPLGENGEGPTTDAEFAGLFDDALATSILDELRSDHAAALRLSAEGYSHREIATMLDRSAPQIKALLYRARSAFKDVWTRSNGVATTIAVLSTAALERLVRSLPSGASRLFDIGISA